ncbi:MAG: hypothetical protein WC623_23655 [Pedobacter sp.]|uniref:hypothetical protein n=1 Tax=Pedobacter sp. TaxID=1411316 RepID=UPI003564AA99
MKRIIFMAALVLNLAACDNTKVRLRAPETASNAAATDVTLKSDSATNNSLKKDSTITH